MKRVTWLLAGMIGFVLLISLLGTQASGVVAQGPVSRSGSMPGRPLPDKPIPHHEPGHLSRAGNYQTEVVVPDALNRLQTVQIVGADAMAADGLDPLGGNYTLVNWDTILWSSSQGDQLNLDTFRVDPSADPPAINSITGSAITVGAYPHNDITATDLNNDGQTEQIAAWLGDSDRIYMSIGEMPGSLGRTTSKPAAVVHDDGSMDLLVRGYDETLWHRHYDGSDWGEWNNNAGGLLLSSPAVASQGNGSFDVFIIGSDNQIHQRHWDGVSWSTFWKKVGESNEWKPLDFWFGPTPELGAPAAVARGGQIDLFRLGPDNTLRWLHSNDGTNWSAWQDLGGMLASGPSVASKGPDHMQIFTRGVDESLWHRTYNGSWDSWQRDDLYGLNAGVTIATAPSVAAAGNLVDVYVTGSDDQLWQTQCNNTSCGSWNPLGNPDGLDSAVAVASGVWKYFVQVESGSLMYSSDGSTWEDFGGLTPWHLLFDTELTGQIKAIGEWQDFSIRVEPGHFWGDGRSQIALAYYSNDNQVSIVIYEFAEGFRPHFVTNLALTQPIDYFNMTTGDFLEGDGVDEIALVYTLGNTYTLVIIEVTHQGLTEKTTSEVEIVTIPDEDGDDYEYGYFTGTSDIASGDFDGDGQDEIGLITVWHQYDWIWMDYCDSYIYSTRMRVYDLTKNLGTGKHSLKTYYVGEDRWGLKGAWWAEAIWDDPDPDRPAEIVGLAITAGDVDSDGKDELVRTWPVKFDTYANSCDLQDEPVTNRFVRKLEVLSLPNNQDIYTNTWDSNHDGLITSAVITKVDERSWTPSYQDRLVVGDLNRDLAGEIVWQMNDEMRTYHLDPLTDPVQPYLPFSENLPLATMKYPKLVTGNFTRESIRVGRPSYRVQNRVDTLLAVVNMPPKHQDLIRDSQGEYVLVESPIGECTPSPDSPNCNHAKYAKLDYTSSQQTIKTTHAYEISGGIENEACVGGGVAGIAEVNACTRRSLNLTHGGNFEKSTEEIQAVTFKRKVIAANDDKVVYFGTPYGVWEYPILSGNSGGPENASITVAFPLVAMTQYPDTSGGYYGGTCDEAWFSAGHQPNNVWSYDPFGDITFSDYNDKYEPAYDAFEGDWAEGEITQLHTNIDFKSVEFNHKISARLETEVTAKADLKLVNVSGSVKAHIQGDYSHTSLKTDTLENTDETTFSYFLAPQPDSAKFTTRVLFYRAKDNALVLNYQAEPGRSASWQLYDKPDPAFILPWYGFPDPENPDPPPCGPDQKLFSPDIVVRPRYAELGEMVTVSATVRNFSNEQTGDVLVRFFQGDPEDGNVIGQQTIPDLARVTGPRTVSIKWTATGVGEQKIFAVIDPEDAIPEMHDGDDLIDNNVGYGLVQLSAAGIGDMGQIEEQPYDVISYTLASPGPLVSLYVPRASLSAVAQFEVGGAEITAPTEDLAGHMAFEVQAFQGSKYKMWDEPIKNFNLKPEDDFEHHYPPAVITVAYSNADIADLIEANLTLYRFDGFQWEAATCPGYQIVRFPDDNLIAVPVCKTGVFALSDTLPPIGDNFMYLPLVTGSGGPAPGNGPDLVGSFQLSPDKQTFSAGEAVQVDARVTNQGNVTAQPFWVDFYINPTTPPTEANNRWDGVCGLTPCLGLAWFVSEPLAPGQSIDLSSVMGSYTPEQSYWPGYFVNGTSDLYLYVDSWKPGIDLGAVVESNETNNRSERHGLLVTGPNPAMDPRSLPIWLRPQTSK